MIASPVGDWFPRQTFQATDFVQAELLAAKTCSVSVVIPARNEQATVGGVVSQIRSELAELVDEVIVIDSDSTDDTARIAGDSGATVWAARDIRPDLDSVPGKGEALWKALFVAKGEICVFIDADLTEWGPHFVTGLLGPLFADENTLLVKGFYDRLADDLPEAAGEPLPQGGRVTELVGRPLLNLYWPELAAVVQPLAGEWAIRRRLIEALSIPVGYGVEFATLVDTFAQHGLDAIAQVDLGRRGHRHQNVHDLGLMAAEILATGLRRLPGESVDVSGPSGVLWQFDRSLSEPWVARAVPLAERPPAMLIDGYRSVAC